MNNDSPLPTDSQQRCNGAAMGETTEGKMMDYVATSFNGIVKHVVAVTVAEIGAVYFQRPRLYNGGAKHWHVDFQFQANGVRYYGTVWNRDKIIELRGHYETGKIMTLPENAKVAWRAAIRKAAIPLIDAACKTYCDAIDSGNIALAERLALGREAPATISSKGLPANRESELRDALALIRVGQAALNMADNVTPAMVACNARQAEFLGNMAHKRYRGESA